ncbi:MAG TPA: hypothetical protein VKH64_03835 [Candidatus Binatia bacterium]|nr:hypothetical protein [Candidatus Binatia bacterium]
MNARAQRLFVPMIFGLLMCLAGCSTSTRLVSEWSNPGYAGRPFRRVLVGGSGGGESAVRRNLEDEFVTQLQAAGLEAVPSYRYIPDEQNVTDDALKQAAKQAGADAAIFVRALGVEPKVEYRPGYYYPYTSFGFFGPHFGGSWYGLYGPSVYQYNVYSSESTLYDVAKGEVVWTGTVRSYDPDNVNAAIKNYVQIVLKALEDRQILRTSRQSR